MAGLVAKPLSFVYRIEPHAVRMLRVINARGAFLNERARKL
ncbi:MAG: hypothetical protein ACREVG_03020 [Burkholderiales bacterium]